MYKWITKRITDVEIDKSMAMALYNWRFELYMEMFKDNTKPTFEEHFRYLKSEINSESQHWIGIFYESNLIGCCSIDVQDLECRNRVEFGRLMVDPYYTEKGVGKELSQYAIDYIEKRFRCKYIWLEVLNTNKKAISLYKKIGFTEKGLKGKWIVFLKEIGK